MKNNTPKRWKQLSLIVALPMLFGAAACDQTDGDVDALIDGPVTQRWAGGNNVRLNLLSTHATRWNEPFVDWAMVMEAAKESASGHADLDALILTAHHEAPIGVQLGSLEDGTSDPCTVSIPEGSALLGEIPVQIQVTTNTEFGARAVLNEVKNEDHCEGDGFYFEETESGEFGQMSMCPSSCETVLAADEAGMAVMVDVVLREG
ncbi:MAG: hypothetical protein ACE37F_00535 [Nannocystaceae bacterium]|nr:hypothetical protein [bacterium]